MKIRKKFHILKVVFAFFIFSSLSFAQGKKAEILYDTYGIPHIYAQNDMDAAFAFGYVQAKDRMFMMDAMRRVATGRMCEILGSFALLIDRKYIVYDFEGTAKKQWAVMAPESRNLLQMFADGVNYAVEKGEHSKFLYEKLNVKPEPFTPMDTLVIANFTAFLLEESVSRKMMMLDLISQVGKKRGRSHSWS
jgi:penicillin amidase